MSMTISSIRSKENAGRSCAGIRVFYMRSRDPSGCRSSRRFRRNSCYFRFASRCNRIISAISLGTASIHFNNMAPNVQTVAGVIGLGVGVGALLACRRGYLVDSTKIKNIFSSFSGGSRRIGVKASGLRAGRPGTTCWVEKRDL